MPRQKITLPDKFIFSKDITIRIGDINYRNHLGHEACIEIMHEARVSFMKSLGFFKTGDNVLGLIIADMYVTYMRQALYGQTLRVELALTDFTDKGFDVIHRVSDAETGVEVARAQMGLLFYDYRQKKTVPIPPGFMEKVSG